MIDSVNFSPGRVTVSLNQTISRQVLINVGQTIMTHPAFPSVTGMVWNLAPGIEFELRTMDFFDLVEITKHSVQISRPIKLAIVSGSQLGYGMARAFQSYAARAPWQTGVFRSERAAENWLEKV